MTIPIKTLAAGAAVAALLGAPLAGQEPVEVTAEFVGVDGQSHGIATLTQAPTRVLIRAELTGVPEGAKGFHIHETGACEPPFESAGGHFDPSDAAHGYRGEGGPHAGDLPNLHIPAAGALTVELFSALISLQADAATALLDDDGAALVLHAAPDDYASDPSGQSGDRIACAVVMQ